MTVPLPTVIVLAIVVFVLVFRLTMYLLEQIDGWDGGRE